MIIGICGSGSGSGKTTMAEELLKSLTGGGPPGPKREARPWGAIKFTKTSVYTSVVTDPDVLLREGKDTARMLGAGARSAAWVRSPGGGDLSEALSMALRDLESHGPSGGHHPLCGIIVEGNSAVELLKPDIVIFMCGPFFKKGAEAFLGAADVVCGPRHGLARVSADAGKNKKGAVFCDGMETCVSAVLKLIDERGGEGTYGHAGQSLT
ncbi:MAG: hypothetical protein M0Z58_01885 [Nitrospiraceae bacterium]|nr:hypothetical protein [Nitrospiraceae bacterium]